MNIISIVNKADVVQDNMIKKIFTHIGSVLVLVIIYQIYDVRTQAVVFINMMWYFAIFDDCIRIVQGVAGNFLWKTNKTQEIAYS